MNRSASNNAAYYDRYINLVDDINITDALQHSGSNILRR